MKRQTIVSGSAGRFKQHTLSMAQQQHILQTWAKIISMGCTVDCLVVVVMSAPFTQYSQYLLNKLFAR